MSEPDPDVRSSDLSSSTELEPSEPVTGAAGVDQARESRPGQEALGPRQFSISTLLVATALYALLFGVLRAAGTAPVLFVVITLFFTAVGLGQAFLFGGKRPQVASMIVGACFIPCLEVFDATMGKGSLYGVPVSFTVDPMADAIAGWVCGRIIAGGFAVGFYLLDRLKRLFGVLLEKGDAAR